MEKDKNWFQKNKGLSFFMGLLVIIIIGLFAWLQFEKNNFNKRLDRQKSELIVNSRNLIEQNRRYLVLELVRALSWVARSEAVRNNYDQINMYLSEFVKTPDFDLALFVDAEGIITIATDKRMEQSPVADHFPADVTTREDADIQVLPDNRWMVSAPVMGLGSRLGSVILIYDPPAIAESEFMANQ